MSYALYVTHPQVVIDPAIPVPRWGLSERGRARAEALAQAELVRAVKRIVSSTETKARETAAILAAASGATIDVLSGFEENDRSATGYVPQQRFLELRDAFFGSPDASVEGWETARAAQQRIVGAVLGVLASHDPAVPIAFVGHGAVGTLLKCHFGKRPISVAEDQPDGGGNVFTIRLPDHQLSSDWTPMETFGH